MEEGTGVLEPSRSCKKLIGPEGPNEELEGNDGVLRIVETFLRLLPIGLSVAALVIMIKNSQENEYGSVSYTDLSAFRYLVHANGICAGYSLFSAVIVALPRLSTMPGAWAFFLLDQVLTYIILAAGAASAEVLYLAEKGNMATTWSSACSSFVPFCHKVTASTAITFVVVVCYVLLSLISSYKLFSKYDAPAVSNPR
ncbi:CASP protein 2A1 [Spatholobus suberectus]|nr:CASP protein 2A1 [Spatholobus suberectus]